jgi:hypothetical protein
MSTATVTTSRCDEVMNSGNQTAIASRQAREERKEGVAAATPSVLLRLFQVSGCFRALRLFGQGRHAAAVRAVPSPGRRRRGVPTLPIPPARSQCFQPHPGRCHLRPSAPSAVENPEHSANPIRISNVQYPIFTCGFSTPWNFRIFLGCHRAPFGTGDNMPNHFPIFSPWDRCRMSRSASRSTVSL